MRQPARAMESQMSRVIYDSVVLLPFGEEGQQGLKDIVTVAQARNPALGITGVLYCDGAYFMQILEGPARAVEHLMARITRDTRHTDVRIVSRGPSQDRAFPDWSMALVTEDDMARALARHPDMPDVHPYRGAELMAAMRTVLTSGTQEPSKTVSSD